MAQSLQPKNVDCVPHHSMKLPSSLLELLHAEYLLS